MEQLKAALTFLAARAFARLFARANLRRFKRRRLARANNRVYATINGSGVADDASNRNNQRGCINSSASITSASALWIIRITKDDTGPTTPGPELSFAVSSAVADDRTKLGLISDLAHTDRKEKDTALEL